MAHALKSERLELRLTPEQKANIEAAARVSGKTITEFGLPVLLTEAETVLENEAQRVVSAAALRDFAEILERPSRPIEAVTALFRSGSVFTAP